MGWNSEDLGRPADVATVFVSLLVAAAYMPARVYLANFDKFPHPERLLAIIAGYWVAAALFFVLMWFLTRNHWAALCSSVVFGVLVGSGGSLSILWSTAGALIGVVVLALALGLVLARFDVRFQRFAALVAAALAAAGPVAALIGAERYDDDLVSIEQVGTPIPTSLEAKPDIFVILLDGFPGETALEVVYDRPIQWEHLADVKRFDAWTSYPITLSSVVALFEMGPPLADGTVIDSDTRDVLTRHLSGENRFFQTMDDQGYETTYLESGWSRSYCDDSVDQCVASPFLDEGVFGVLHQSVVGDYVAGRFGSGLTVSALSAIDWLEDHLPRLAVNDRPDFVFASVVLPHPPLMLDAGCSLRTDGWRGGNSLYVWDQLIEARRAAFLDQAACAATIEMELMRSIPDGPLLVFLSDHGGDSTGQLSTIGHEWSDEDIVERMSAHLAIRSPHECELSEPVFVSDVLWQHLWCLAGEPRSPEHEAQMYIAERIAEPKVLRLEEVPAERLLDLGVSSRSP